MKKFFFLIIAMAIAVTGFAQNSLVATLTHGDQISMYYGAYALKNAHAAAADGDIINLSGGTFQSTTITKGITVRGTGINDSNPTYISGAFDINVPSETTDRLSFEGCRISNQITIRGTLTNAYFMKNDINRINVSSDANLVNGMFAVCNVYSMFLDGTSSVQFVNCHVENFNNIADSSSEASFVNCVIRPDGGYLAEYIRSSQLVNCILYWTRSLTGYKLPSTSLAVNCVAVGYGSSGCFNNLASKQNCSYAELDIFTDSNVWNDLTDEAKEKYLGNDGTPVGMYGGSLPYDMTPSYPQITKMNVASKTTADGKLSVEIEVSAAQ